MFFFDNKYSPEAFKATRPNFEAAANNNCYPLGQSTIQETRLNYVPLSVDRKEFAKVKTELSRMFGAIVKLLNHYRAKGALAEKLGLSADEAELFEGKDYSSLVGVLRFDLLYSSTGFKVVEIDADPDALFLHDMSFNTLATYYPKNYVAYPNHADLYKRLMDEIGVEKNSSGLILLDPKTGFKEEYEINKRVLEASGYRMKFLSLDDSVRLEEYDFVKRAYEFHRMKDCGEIVTLKTLHAKKCVNPVVFRLVGYKSLFMHLHSAAVQDIFTDEERDAIASLIPKTEVCVSEEQRTFLFDKKDSFVVKPVLGAEGVDVYVGRGMSEDEWKNVLEGKVTTDGAWLFQELVDTATVEYQDQAYEAPRTRYFDFSPHMFVFKDEYVFGKNLVRYSDNKILNVAQGGSFGYGIEVD